MADDTVVADAPSSRAEGLAAALRPYAQRHDVGANRPVELVGDVAWYVLEGDVDVFVQQHTDDVIGRRQLLCSAPAGTLLWTGGQPDVPHGWRLLAVGHAGTQLLRASGTQVHAGTDPAVIAEHVETFVGSVVAGSPTPSDGAATMPGDGAPPDGSDARISAARDAFRTALRRRIDDVVDQDARDAERIGTEPDRQHRILESALADLIEVVDRREPLTAVPEDQLAQLDMALARLGRQIGATFEGDVGLEDTDDDPVLRRVNNAGCRARPVTLAAGWWAKPGLPLLGFFDDDRPVALLPVRSGYGLYDPQTASTTRVDQGLAGRLAPLGYSIYRPLPADATTARSLLRSALPDLRREVTLLVLLGVVAGMITLLTPIVTTMVYDSVLPVENTTLLLAVSALLVGASVTWAFVSLSQNLALVRISGRLSANLEPGLTDRLLRLPADFFRNFDTGDLVTRAGGLLIIRQQLSGAVITSFLTLVFSVFNVALLFVYSPLLGVVALGILVVVAAVLVPLNVRVMNHQQDVFEATGAVAAELFQVMQAVPKVRIAAAESRIMTRWAALFRRQQRETYAAGRVQAWIFAIIAALPGVLGLGLYAVAGTTLVGELSAGDFLGVLTALGQFTAALVGVAVSIGPTLTVVPLWRRLRVILQAPLEAVGESRPGTLSGAMALRDVSFRYGEEGDLVVKNVSLTVRPGQFVAITGPSGSGKSTLLRLLLGLDRPTSGTVLYDGKDLASLDARIVRQQVGVVMQGARPLPGEILSTILGDTPGAEADAWTAAEAAELAGDIRRMPMRMHTIIGEGGLAFSGGQVQRMMIARALARRPRILFLDEATSALDDRVQAKVSDHITTLDTTRVVIAHRLSTVRNADQIYVVDAGEVVEAGTFEELTAHDGPFTRLAARQLV